MNIVMIEKQSFDAEALAELVEDKLSKFGEYINDIGMFSLVDRISTEGSLIKIYEGQRDVDRNEGVMLSAITEEVEIKKYIKKVDNILKNLLIAKEYGFVYVYYVQ